MDGWHVSVVAETGSTNDDLLRAAERGELVDRTVLRAEHQTAGRGRLDRRWDAPAGSSLLASMYLMDPDDRPTAMLQRVGIAIVDAVNQMVGLKTAASKQAVLGLKWPNDVLYDGRKLAGVLAQRSTSVPGLIVGFGVNVAWAPPEAARINDFADCTAEQLLVDIIKSFDSQSGDPAVLAQTYRAQLLTLGQFVRVHLPGDLTFEGQAVDVDVEGRIIVVSEMGVKRVFDVGDVVHLRLGTHDAGITSD